MYSSIGTAWLDVRNSHKEISKAHTNVYESLKKDIIAPLEQFKKEKQAQKEKISNEEKNLIHHLKSMKEKVESVRIYKKIYLFFSRIYFYLILIFFLFQF